MADVSKLKKNIRCDYVGVVGAPVHKRGRPGSNTYLSKEQRAQYPGTAKEEQMVLHIYSVKDLNPECPVPAFKSGYSKGGVKGGLVAVAGKNAKGSCIYDGRTSTSEYDVIDPTHVWIDKMYVQTVKNADGGIYKKDITTGRPISGDLARVDYEVASHNASICREYCALFTDGSEGPILTEGHIVGNVLPQAMKVLNWQEPQYDATQSLEE